MQNNPPQIGIDFNKGRQAKAEWKQAVAKAADNVAFWDAVSGIINQQSAEQTTQEAQPIAQQENATEQAEQPSQAAQESVAENTTIAEPSATEQESVAPQIAEEQPTNEGITPEEDALLEGRRQSEVGNIVDEVTQYLANESSADEDVAFSTSTEIDELYPNWLEGTTTDSGKHSTQVEGTRKTYGKVGTWIEENLGKDVAILDASSGMGYGTADLRERGFNIEDVEPYQSEERKQNNPATYSSYADIRKQYDYIISNAVLNVIPDDWRSNVLHDMANRLKTGGRMFINTRKAGEEKSIKDKIELDSPQEVLVKRNGRIASYQRFFTPQELKSWVEEELGEGYSVEIANEKNSGTKGLAAVVVTKSDDISFSIIGEQGASALDRADEATHRMDNLNIAREMAEGNLFQYFAGTLSELISRAKASAQGLIKKVIAPVSSRLKDDLAQQGVELDDNYKHVIDNNAIRHTLNNHSGSSEEKRGQIPVTESDFDRIEDVVENYDSIVVDNGKRGNINILYSKTYADGTTIYIEEKRNKRKELAMVTMWKMKNPTLTDANRSETTPIPDLNEVSTGKDTTTSSNTQQNGELFKRGDIYDYKTGDKITMQNVNVALYREHGPYGQALNQDVSFRGVVLGWGKDYQIDVERLNENLDKALIILEEYKEHLTSLKSNATTPAQKVIDEQIAKIDASMDWANQTKENPSLFHERWHNAPFLELLRPIAEEVVNAEFPDNPSVVAQQTAEALGVDIEIDEALPAKGSYNTRTGRIRINPHRHSSPQDIERTILHEVIGHGDLQALAKHRMPHSKEVLTKKTAQKIAQYNF